MQAFLQLGSPISALPSQFTSSTEHSGGPTKLLYCLVFKFVVACCIKTTKNVSFSRKIFFKHLNYFFKMVKKELKLRLFWIFQTLWVVGQVLRSWVKHFASFLPTVLDILTSRLSVSICHFFALAKH